MIRHTGRFGGPQVIALGEARRVLLTVSASPGRACVLLGGRSRVPRLNRERASFGLPHTVSSPTRPPCLVSASSHQHRGGVRLRVFDVS